MIRIKQEKYRIDRYKIDAIKDRMAEETCKTNVSPQLMFRQSFSGVTLKTFVGNWTKNGFWVSKFRLQLIQLRPDIIAKFNFSDRTDNSIVSIRYSIGFSSLFIGSFWIAAFPLLFVVFGLIGYLIGLVLMLGLYILLTIVELNNLREKILDRILKI